MKIVEERMEKEAKIRKERHEKRISNLEEKAQKLSEENNSLQLTTGQTEAKIGKGMMSVCITKMTLSPSPKHTSLFLLRVAPSF